MKFFSGTKNVLNWYKHLSIVGWIIVPPFFLIALVADLLFIVFWLLAHVLRIFCVIVLVCLGWLIVVGAKVPFTTYSDVVEDAWGFTKPITEI